MTASQVRVRSGKASLVGGIVVGIACFVLWTAIAHDVGADTLAWLIVGLVVSAAVAAWIWLADL